MYKFEIIIEFLEGFKDIIVIVDKKSLFFWIGFVFNSDYRKNGYFKLIFFSGLIIDYFFFFIW